MDSPDIQVIDRKTPYHGYLKVDRYRLRHIRFDGTWSTEVMREVCDRGDAVGVLLYDPDLDMVVLIEQFRAGVAATGRHGWLMEIVAGLVDKDEAPEDVAHREAMEETGCTVRQIEFICDYFPSPGVLTEHVTVYCGRVDSRGVGGLHGLAEEGEDIRVDVMPADQAIGMLDANRLNNSVSIIALAWLARHRDALRQRWLAATS
jgi:ADP-ribose pyrophosphatase